MTEPSLFMQLAQNFHFLRPLWLLALIPALLLVVYLWRINESASSWDRAIDKDLLPYLLDNTKSVAERTPLVLLLTLWSLAILALAGPVWEKIAQPVQQRQDALVIVYDQSLSMYAADFDPNRLTVSKRKVLDVLDMRTEGQTALVVYAGDAHTVTPLTEDSVTIRALVPSINPNIMPSFGSNIIAAVERAKGLLTDAGAASGSILLVTDGIERRDHAAIGEMLQQTGCAERIQITCNKVCCWQPVMRDCQSSRNTMNCSLSDFFWIFAIPSHSCRCWTSWTPIFWPARQECRRPNSGR